jgi:phage portal protein BeeE
VSLFFTGDAGIFSGDSTAEMIARRTARRNYKTVTPLTALRSGAVWACRRLRADLISTLPIDIFRSVGGVDVEMAKPPLFITPDGRIDWEEWLYSSQDDLDSIGNAVGIITQKDGNGLPSRIELIPHHELSIKCQGAYPVTYYANGEKFTPDQVWHERQFTRSGLGIGLSPIAHAAMSIGGYLSAQQFAADWFAGGGFRLPPQEDRQGARAGRGGQGQGAVQRPGHER